MDELYFLLSCYFSYAAKLQKLCFQGQTKANVDFEYSVRTFTLGICLAVISFLRIMKFVRNKSFVASDSPTAPQLATYYNYKKNVLKMLLKRY